jgi:hypothetical protein
LGELSIIRGEVQSLIFALKRHERVEKQQYLRIEKNRYNGSETDSFYKVVSLK